MKRIAILGSTGSIGKSALQIVTHLKQELKITALAARTNSELLISQAQEFAPLVVAIWDKERALEVEKRLPHIPVLAGPEGVASLAADGPFDLLLSAISGAEGIVPTLRALEKGRSVALANKETLVAAGELVMQLVKEKGATLIPVDSEHTALFQCLKGENPRFIERLILTASGGPFREYSNERLEHVGVAEALCHPNYRMGPKVTIDSSTLMNKGLEMIEAHHLYGISASKIEVVIHPEQIIHSLAAFVDGSILAQLSEPNMLFPIQYALTYPKRLESPLPPFDFQRQRALNFFPADLDRFKCLKLAYDSMRVGGSMPCYMNAANEVLVSRFLSGEIRWSQIGQKLERLMEKHTVENSLTLEKVVGVDARARQEAAKM